MTVAPLVIEKVTLVAPLGLRFRDGATNALIGSGLTVSAYALGRPHRCVEAVVNSAGVYSFAHLPGLREYENGAGDAAYWATLPAPKPFVVTVADREQRFLPASFQLQAPTRGIFALPVMSPPSPLAPQPAAIPLFSSPTRPPPAGMAVVRAHLWDEERQQAAAWALVAAQPPGQPPVLGMADAEGRLTLYFPYPAPPPPAVGSPPGSPLGLGVKPLWQQQWSLGLMAFYTPQATTTAPPDLAHLLQQDAALLWATRSPLQPLTQVTLAYGQELILRTAESGGKAGALLSITPGGSPLL